MSILKSAYDVIALKLIKEIPHMKFVNLFIITLPFEIEILNFIKCNNDQTQKSEPSLLKESLTHN